MNEPKKALVLSDLDAIRRDNLRRLADVEGGNLALARKLGYRSPSFLSQMVGPNPGRRVTEKLAREAENVCELPRGTLDHKGWDPHAPAPAPAAPAASSESVAVVTEVIRAIGAISATDNVAVPQAKFADLVAMAFADAVANGGTVHESRLRQYIHLLK